MFLAAKIVITDETTKKLTDKSKNFVDYLEHTVFILIFAANLKQIA
jgi:hypothetical protein